MSLNAFVEAVRPLLTPISGRETVTATWRPPHIDDDDDDDDDPPPNAPLHLPIFKLCPGKHLWQLAEIDPNILHNYFEQPGFIVRLSNKVYAVVGDEDIMETVQLTSGSDSSCDYVMVGPEFSSTSHEVSVRLYFPETSLPLRRGDRPLVQVALEAVLRFVAHVPCFSGDGRRQDRSTLLSWIASDQEVIEPEDIMFPLECLQDCFQQDDGEHPYGELAFMEFQLSPRLLSALAQVPIVNIRFDSVTVPRSFLLTSLATRMRFNNCLLRDDPDGPIGITTKTLTVKQLEGLDTLQGVDTFLSSWASVTYTLKLGRTKFSTESWSHLWRSPFWQENKGCTSLAIGQTIIDGQILCHEHLAAIPRGDWVIQWTCHGQSYDGVTPALLAKRVIHAASREATAFFRPSENPLLGQHPPLCARQSVILEALLRTGHDPNESYRLAQVFTPVLTQPTTENPRRHDTETTLVELRALVTDHQAIIELLLNANNALQQRHARDGQQLCELLRQVENEKRQRQQFESRQESRMRAMELQRQETDRRQASRMRELEELVQWMRQWKYFDGSS